MPAVNAIKVLEQMGDDAPASSRGPQLPGLLIVVQQNGAQLTAHQPTIDVKPLKSNDGVSDDNHNTD